MAGGIGIWLDDWQSPTVEYVGPTPEGWVKSDATPRTVTVYAADGGLGVQSVRMFGVGTQNWWWNKGSCAGTYDARCPTWESGQVTFTTNGFPYEGRYDGQGGERNFTVQVADPTGKTGQVQRPIWVDATAPSVSLSGQLATVTDETGSVEKPQDEAHDHDQLSLPTYKLLLNADDGADRSGVKEIKIYLDKDPGLEPTAPVTARVTAPAASCPVAGCPRTLSMEYMLRLAGLEPGKHSVWIVAVDKVGNASPPSRNIEFEYFPATGMKDEYVMQHIPLPDGHDYSAESEYHGPEIAVNVINGNVVFHQRDVNVDTERASLELERVYNSQQPVKQDTQWGRGWAISQAPTFEVESGQATATMQRRGTITGAVPVPQANGQSAFSARLRANVTKTTSGYDVEPAETEETEAFDTAGKVQEVVLGNDEPAYLAPRTEEELELMSPGAPTYTSAFGAAGTGNGQFSHPAGVAVDAKGTIWVVDQGNRRVEKFNAAGEFQSAFGSAGSGNGQFGRPTDIAVDAAGNLWVTDAGNSVVDKFNEKGEFLAKFGSYGTGNGQFHEAESIAIDAQGNIWIGDTYNGRLQKFNAAFEFIKVVGAYGSNAGQMIEPTGIDIGPGGAVWVADWGNNRVSVFNASGEFVRQFGSGGTGNGQFARPDVVEVDSRGNVWVGDQNNGRVQQFDQTGKYVAQFGAKGSGVGQFSFSWPMGIASDTKGNLWIADTANNRVQRWAIPAYTPVYASSFGSTGTGNGQFSHPADVAIDAQGNLWVPDKQNNRIQKFNPKGEFLAKYGTAGSGAGQISAPSSIAFDSTGSFWVAEHGNSRLQKFNSSGEALKTAGAYGSANGQFNGPEGVTIAPNGHIFVADTYNYRIQELNAAGEFIKVVNPGGLGAIEPTGIAADPAGNVWVTDWSHNRVVELSEAGALLRSFGTAGSGDGQFNRPDAIEIDGQGNVWVGDQNNSRVQIFNSSAEFVTKFGSGGSGEGQFSFSYPIGFAVTANGSAWIADANNNRIQRWRMAGVVPGGPEPKVVAPYFDAPAVDYEYENGKLAAMQLEDEATKGADPEIALAVEEGKVTEAESAEAGDTVYSYEGPSMTAADGADGETKYTYDTSGRLSSVELPNGTIATILYDGTQRATSVTVDPAGPEGAKATHFTYVNEPRKTTVWGSGLDEITYEIGEDGGVFKWQWAAFPPAIAALTGSLVSQKEQLIEKNKDQTLFVTGNSPHGIASIKVLTNGNSVAYEETCQEPEPPNGKCNQWTMPWVSNSSDFPPGRLDVEVIVTDMAGRQASERLWVTVPPPDPPDPNVVPRPDFDSVKLQREETGLDREKSLNTFQLTELVLELMYEWERADYAPVRAVEQFGVPMRQPELTEMEFRRAYIAQASEVIPEWAEANAPSTYGGYYVDERAGGILRVGFVGTPEQQAASVAALKASGVLMAPARVEPMPVPPAHALVNVQALEPSVANYVSGNPSAAALTDAVGYSADTGRVVVESSNPAALGSIISGQFGAGAPIEVIAATPEMSSLSRYKTDGVVFGGDWMLNGARGGACTANYSGETQVGVTRGVPDIAYFKLTAGHCGDYGDRFWRKAAKSVSSSPSLENPKWAPVGKVGRSGFVAAGPEGSFTDALAIPVEHWKAQSSNVFTGDPNSYLQMYGMSRMKLNRRYCWSGINGGLNCGRAFEILRRSFSDHPGHPTWKMYVYGPNIQGDSGSPVWDEKTGKAVGILSGQKAGPKRGCVVKPQVNNNSWCPVTSVTPLLPFADKSYPIGAIQALGVGFVRGL
jgi:YD repeat-containing protein